MKKRYWILGIGAAAILIVGAIFYNRVKVSVDKNEDGAAVTIIGGTDGPTSVFLAGKLKGGNDVAEWRMNLLRDISPEQ